MINEMFLYFGSGGFFVAIALGVARWLLPKWIDQEIQLKFSKRLEEHKFEIEKMNKELAFDYQRKFIDFQSYTKEVHERYNKIYVALLELFRCSQRGLGLVQVADVSYLADKDVEKFCKENQVGSAWEQKLLELLRERDFRQLQEEYFSIIKKIDERDFTNARITANRLYKDSLLYLSEDITEKVGILEEKIVDYKFTVQTAMRDNGSPEFTAEAIKKFPELEKEIKAGIDVLVKTMKEELALGYYKK